MTTGARAKFPRFRRLAVVVGVVCLGAATGAPMAAAQLADVSATLSETTAAPLAQTTETLEQATAPTLAETTETVAPLVAPARETQLLPATVEALGAVTESVVTPVAETLPVVEPATRPLLREALPSLGSTLETPAPLSGARDDVSAPDAPSAAGATPEMTASSASGAGESIAVPSGVVVSSDKDELPVSTQRTRDTLPADVDSSLPAPISLPSFAESINPVSGGAEASPPSPSTPPPYAPGGPLSGLAPASASAGAGALVLLLAALAAAFVLAVPGLSRRLRLRLAPWPQPILQLSLERPG